MKDQADGAALFQQATKPVRWLETTKRSCTERWRRPIIHRLRSRLRAKHAQQRAELCAPEQCGRGAGVAVLVPKSGQLRRFPKEIHISRQSTLIKRIFLLREHLLAELPVVPERRDDRPSHTDSQPHWTGNAAAPSSTQEQNAMTAMEARTFGRHLRNIGDDYNRLLLRRMEDPRRRNIVPPNFLPLIHPEPVAMLCVSLLIILIGRLMYSQGCLYDQNNSQV
ncbi:bcl-2-like protein 11 isoform X2 [Nothobranchius furzeri]|uniref:bcl-2-like protein 11 isoform X2 n=1 Tax=Nothobranchius furzeri TaxID=105023 RepID=UPI003904D4B0